MHRRSFFKSLVALFALPSLFRKKEPLINLGKERLTIMDLIGSTVPPGANDFITNVPDEFLADFPALKGYIDSRLPLLSA